jgi:cytoskeletal protein CcmA (bactofilin family)
MWRKPEDTKPATPLTSAAPAAETPTHAPRVEPPAVRSVAGLTAEVVQPSGGTITSTLVIKGEVRGREDLYVDGEVQGSIHLSEGRVTVGPHGKIAADVEAREIVVRGKVKGALRGRDRVEIGSTGEVFGDIATTRIAIGEGAHIHSKVEITRAEESRNNRTPAKGATTPALAQTVAMKAGGDIAN